MFIKQKWGSGILQVLAAGLGVFLMAGGGGTAAVHPTLINHTATTWFANPAPDPACQAVLDAGAKLFTTPYHMYMTEAGAGAGNGKPVSSETVFAGGAMYVLFNGKWSSSPVSAEDMKEMEQRNLKNVKNMSCQHVRDESVNGESAAVYNTHEETEHGKTDSQVWISKSKGLTLRQDIDIDTGGANAKTHISMRMEYSNVHAPKL